MLWMQRPGSLPEKEQIDQSSALKEGERRKGREERKERKVKSEKEG